MATIKLGGIVSDIRGSVGGLVFSRNRGGAYVRQRTAPINPKTALQSAIRAIIAQLTAGWGSLLSDAQRAAWAVFAANVPAKNKLGDVIFLSGFNQYIKANTVLLNAGLAIVADAPILFALPGEDPTYATEVDAGTGIISVAFDDTRGWVDESGAGLIVQMGIPVSPGVTFFDGPWRHAGVILGDDVAAPTSPDTTITVPFEVGDGQLVFTRGKVVRLDGRVSDWFRSKSVVASA